MNKLEEQFKARVESGSVALPVLPAVGAEVMSLAQDQDSDAMQLAKLVQNDQALSGHLMRIANSAAFNTSGQMQTLQQAITRLGMRQIAQMALTISVGESVFKSSAASEQLVDYLWRHALASAAWAREIARMQRSNTEVAFLCGLLHQIGKPVAVNTLVDLLENENEALKEHAAILELLDRYNKVIGVSLARRWQFPESVIETINYIDEYVAAPSAKKEVMIVNAARDLATLTLDGNSREELLQAMSEQAVFEQLNFYPEDLAELADKLDSVQSLLDSLPL